MNHGSESSRYAQSSLERIVAVVVAVGVVILVGYLIVRNEPFADPNLVVITRVILSLAVSVLGATIPGFLNIGWKGSGVVVRAGGALALFCLTFWLTPNVLPKLKDDAIPPLKNPRRIGARTGPGTAMMSLAAKRSQPPPPAITIRAVYEGDGTRQRKYYDVLISNHTSQQRMLSAFKVRWVYSRGSSSSVDQGRSIRPVEKYSIGLPIDPDNSYELFEKSVDVYPPLILPPRNSSGPSVTSIRLEVFYTFEGARINWHPCSDWDIYYDVAAHDDIGSVVKVLSQSWRYGAAAAWIDEYDRKTRS